MSANEVRYLNTGVYISRTVVSVAGSLYVDNGSGTWSSVGTGMPTTPHQTASYLQMIFWGNSSGLKCYSPNGSGGQINATSTFYGFAQAANLDLFEPTSLGGFAGGTVTVASGTVTLVPDTIPQISPNTGTTTTKWPYWAALSGTLNIQGNSYPIATRSSNTVLTIADTSAAYPAGTLFQLQSRFPSTYDMQKSAGGSDAPAPPTNCTLVTAYRGRIVMAGQTGSTNSPLAVYLSASGDYRNWAYGATGGPGDAAAMVAAPTSGSLSDIPTALIPRTNSSLIFGMRGSISILRGDPTNGGTLDLLCDGVGVLSATSWCYDDEGNLWFMSNRGLYALEPNGDAPRAVSPNMLPVELSGIDPSLYYIWLAYDSRFRGLHVHVTKISDSSTNHWWVALKTTLSQGESDVASFWPMTYTGESYVPIGCYARPHFYSGNAVSPVLFGGSSGNVKYWNTAVACGTAWLVDYGPLQLGDEGYAGILHEADLLSAQGSGTITLGWRTGQSAEQAFLASEFNSMDFPSAGLYAKARPRMRGSHAILQIRGAKDTDGSWENLRIRAEQAGPNRFIGAQ